jgi:hypothetical protein
MKINKLKFLIASFGLLVYLFSFVMRVDGVVLCLGQDGHVELETASSDLTCGMSAPVKGNHTSMSTPKGILDKGHCGPCIDVPLTLTSPDIVVRVRSYTIPIQDETVRIQLFAAANLQFSLLPILAETPQEIPPLSCGRHFPLASLRTVILLI